MKILIVTNTRDNKKYSVKLGKNQTKLMSLEDIKNANKRLFSKICGCSIEEIQVSIEKAR